MTAIYKKVGRRYVEIGAYEPEAAFHRHGSHLVVCTPGREITRYNVKPDHAAVMAALEYVRDAVEAAMDAATYSQPDRRQLSEKENAGMNAYLTIAGNPQCLQFEGVSMCDVVDAAIILIAAHAMNTGAPA